MLWLLKRPLDLLREALRGSADPAIVAFSVVLGMMIGLIPKESLLVAALGVVLSATRLNLGAAMLSALAFHWIGLLLDPLAHAVGEFVLTQPTLQPMFVGLMELPLAPWTGMQNTVTAGHGLFSAALAAPVFFATRQFCKQYGGALQNRLAKFAAVRWWLGLPLPHDTPPAQQRAPA